jgi:phosphoribosylformylglycinamidine synthase
MSKPRVLILTAPGTNCEYETQFVFERLHAKADIVSIKKLLFSKEALQAYHILVLPGGFSYGDDISAGKVLANQLKYKLADEIAVFLKDKRLILGICNGFQTLVKMGLLPGVSNGKLEQTATLITNDSKRYESRWVYLKICSKKSEFISKYDTKIITLPVAHGEGKFVPKNQKVLDELETNNQIVFRYVDKNGNNCGYPGNPNGSVRNVAGIMDRTGQILGLMPHPERFSEKFHYHNWTREKINKPHGIMLFESAISYVKRVLL